MSKIERKYNIGEYLGIQENYNNEDIQAILEFVIFWNDIEKGQNEPQYTIIYNYLNDKKQNNKEIEKITLYFINRYNKEPKFNFDILKKENASNLEQERHIKIQGYLKNGKDLNLDERIDFISYIIYRFRNRLFHGNKEIKEEQNENFIMINNFLYSLVEK